MNILVALLVSAVVVMFHNEVPAHESKPALVQAVEPESPAEKAGIQPGDLIVKFDGKENPIWRDVELQVLVNADLEIPVTVKRGDSMLDLRLHVGVRPEGQEKIGYSGLKPGDWRINVVNVSPGSPAEAAGLQLKDNIVAVNGKRLEQTNFGRAQLLTAIQSSNGAPVKLTVLRNGQTVELTGEPRMQDGAHRLGFEQDLAGFEVVTATMSPGKALKHSFDENLRILALTKTALGQVITGDRSFRESVSGPIGIAQMSKRAAQQGVWSALSWTSFVSLNLGVFNLLPIPVLDGGLIFMLLIESLLGLFGLPLTLRIKEKMMQVGFVMLLLLTAFVCFNDIAKSVSFGGSSQQQQAEPEKPPEPR